MGVVTPDPVTNIIDNTFGDRGTVFTNRQFESRGRIEKLVVEDLHGQCALFFGALGRDAHRLQGKIELIVELEERHRAEQFALLDLFRSNALNSQVKQ